MEVGMGGTSRARDLYDALRALEERAKTAYNAKSGHRYSRRLAAQKAEGHDSTLDRRLATWLPDDWHRAKVPDLSSSERLSALVRVWSEWAGEPCDVGRWQTLLDRAQPPRAPLPPVPAPEPTNAAGYDTWVEQKVMPARLLGRDNELRELTAFCTGEDMPGASPYAWWQAGPWAGKSALLSEFVLRHRPDGVECVSYFIADRFARNDQEGFAETVMRQLAPLAGQDPGAAGSRPEDFPALCHAAAEACRNRGRRLVLVVDGLDEDNGATTGKPSIAALLPRNPPAGMRVVVTGRPNPHLPTDVPDDHPLRNSQIVRTLPPSPHATDISRMAERELRRLLEDEQIGVPLLGLLAAARGSLTAADLANLVGVRPYRVGWLLRGITGRSFIPGAQGQLFAPDMPVGERPLALGHDELRKEALTALGDVKVFEDQLHAWADHYRDRGWPSETPAYLLYDYPHMLTSNDDSKRLTAIALDPQRQQALLRSASPDAALSDIEMSAQMIRRHRPDDLTGLAGLAASRAILTEQGRLLPESIAVAFARLGHPHRARQFALLAPHAAEKAVRLASVARALADAGDQHADQAAEAARGAAGWAGRAREESAPTSGDEDEAEAAAAAAAVALITVGDHQQGGELLNSLRSPLPYGDVNLLAETAARASVAARPHSAALAEKLLAQAEQHADDLESSQPADPSAPVRAWAFVASVADPTRAARLHERITQYTQSSPPGLTACVVDAAAASALAAECPEQARALAQQAARRLKTALTRPEALPEEDAGDLTLLLSPMLSAVIGALVDTRCVDDARDLMAGVPEDRHTAFGLDVRAGARAVLADAHNPADEPSAEVLAKQACRLAAQNHPDEAHRRLHQALQALGSSQSAAAPREWWLITLCTALAAVGRHTDAALLARSLRDPAERVQAFAATAASAAAAGHLPDARRLANEAADATSSLEGALNFSLLEGVPGVNVCNAIGAAAQALAYTGERERALALAEKTDDEDGDRRRRALVAVAAGLRAHDPAGAAGIIERQLEHMMTADAPPRMPRGRIADLAELLAAVGDADSKCADRVRDAVGKVREEFKASKMRLRAEDFLVLLLLHAPERRADAENALAAWERRCQGVPPWELPTGAIATAYAALGALAAARESADSLNAPTDRAEALAAVAGYLTGTPTGLRVVYASASTAFTQTVQTLALAQMPPDTARTAQAALPLTTEMLAGDGWHHALPVLARIAPAAVLRVRDIVFAHRQLEAP